MTTLLLTPWSRLVQAEVAQQSWSSVQIGAGLVSDQPTSGQIRTLRPPEIKAAQQALPGQDLILNHAFRVTLRNFGTCLFVPVASHYGEIGGRKLTLNLIREGKVIYTLPSTEADRKPWTFLEIKAISFTELDFDGFEDIILLAEYHAGPGGPGSSEPFTLATFYFNQSGQAFRVDEALSRQVSARKVTTMEQIEKIIRNELNYLP
ncbi:hypothetical protein [Leptolyngbya sp. 'hensonii']|uniref:hypothetical protein n=1 Tax=Leptolyngbya sp. 'hensonii' TaxID=1922337 RepID=UPI00117DD689|nr:hypothetical protein [Leptolyngbya sp. 'hensonii']